MIIERLKRLWKLSEPPKQEPSHYVKVIKELLEKTKQQEARFIPRVTVTPAEKIINESHDN